MAAKNSNEDTDRLNKEMIEKLAARIRTLRKEKGFANYEKFANQFNLSRSVVGRFEKGQNMTFTSILSILRALEVPLSEFFSEGFDE